MQSFLTTISRLIEETDLPALMIGGHAVTALGHPRATFDLDLMSPRSSASRWKAELLKLHYRIFAESANFHQFETHPELPLPPLDLRVVDDGVFQTLELTKTDLWPSATPGVVAMIALKLHAIRQRARDDMEKDWSDSLALIKAHHLSPDDPGFFRYQPQAWRSNCRPTHPSRSRWRKLISRRAKARSPTPPAFSTRERWKSISHRSSKTAPAPSSAGQEILGFRVPWSLAGLPMFGICDCYLLG